ncbi:aldehyde dehydrogenase family protein [Novosphingobium sp. P6W]|nr:aldehyde dehydrogenase family protein [Novosphingobium sp. P6W]
MMATKQPEADWNKRARDLTWDGRALIHGQRIATSKEIEIFSPVDGRYLYNSGLCDAVMIDRAVRSSRSAFERGNWSGISPQARASKLLRLAELIVRDHEELALRDTLEMGKPIGVAVGEVAGLAPVLCRYYAECADKIYGEVPGTDQGSIAFSLREPRGVVAAIAPWNYPLANAIIKSLPALAAGNCVVLKPSEMTPGSALRFGELALEAGLPDGVLNVVPGDGIETGASLVSHSDIDMVTFTGSTATGRAIMALASSRHIRPVMLECGGKSPQIVFADAPPTPDLAPHILGEILVNQGQLCVARSRLLVHRSRKEELLAKLASLARQHVVGDPLDMGARFGPLAGTTQRDRVMSYISSAQQAGAHLVAGGASDRHCGVLPTIFDHVADDMAVVKEEIFGPVLTVQTFDTVDDAVRLANSTRYGLAATVWTEQYPVIHAMVRRLKCGQVTVRSSIEAFEGPGFALAGEPQGDSGFGGETGLDALRNYTAVKGVILAGGR